MLADDFLLRVAERRKEVLICSQDSAIELELDHGLGAPYGGDLRLQFRSLLSCFLT